MFKNAKWLRQSRRDLTTIRLTIFFSSAVGLDMRNRAGALLNIVKYLLAAFAMIDWPLLQTFSRMKKGIFFVLQISS